MYLRIYLDPDSHSLLVATIVERFLYIYKLSIRSAAPLLCLISLALFVFAGTETETETETANWAKVSNDHFEGFRMGDSQAAAT